MYSVLRFRPWWDAMTISLRCTVLFFAVVTFGGYALTAQNLVPNGDFEQYSECPWSLTQIYFAPPWLNGNPGAIQGATSDFFHSCAQGGNPDVPTNIFGSQLAHSGEGYAGLATYVEDNPQFREYMQVQFSAPLTVGQCYTLTLYLSLAEGYSSHATGVGAYFSVASVAQTGDTGLWLNPQLDQLGGLVTETDGWVQVSGTYEAGGGEQYLVLGNFHDDANTTTLLVDSTLPWHRSYYYIDDVSIVPSDLPCGPLSLSEATSPALALFPVPATNELHVRTNARGKVSLTVHNAAGQVVLLRTFTGQVELQVGHLPVGIYSCELHAPGGYMVRERFCKQ